jgi:crotonobetainyl-CoA:carnitine CoA-transferase CaiB-like acyl-CoA transferase
MLTVTAAEPAIEGPRPLAGIRVLDFTRVVAGPFATRMLADLGADVVKVEPPEGDITRIWGDVRGDQSGFYVQQNVGKRNISVDLRVAGASALLADLAAEADIVVENFRPGIMARHGLDFASLSVRNPRLVMASISGFGQNSSQSGRAAYAPILHAESGLIARQAHFDGAEPTDPVLSIADTNAALHALVAILAALHLRHTTGRGQHIDLAMLNAMTVTDDYAHHALDGEPARRLGGVVWATGTGPLLVSANDQALWFLLSRAGRIADGLSPDTPIPEKIATRRRLMEEWFAGFADRASLLAELDAMNIAWGDVIDPGEVFDTAIAAERRLCTTVDDRAGGRRRVTESPYHFSGATSGVAGPAPHRGEHHHGVLGEWLGMSTERVASLEADGVLVAPDLRRASGVQR